MQNSLAIGWNSDSSTKDAEDNWPGAVTFSSIAYWVDDNQELKSEYGTDWYNNNIYDANYNDAPGSDNYSIAYYVETYKAEIEKLGVEIQDARLLTYSEAVNLGCIVWEGCPTGTEENSFMTETTFWLSTADYSDCVYFSDSVFNSFYGGDGYFLDTSQGVRPIIIVNTSDM